jgi:hypothetical protein
MNENLIEKLQDIVKDEKFRMDAYFFCGFPSGTPNEKLLKACEKYLDCLKKGKPGSDVTTNMINELEATLTADLNSDVANSVNNTAEIREILAHKDLL